MVKASRMLAACAFALLSICWPGPAIIGATRLAQYTKATPEWNRPVKPFRIIGNIYYVGAAEVSSFLITTSNGHIILDSGFSETVPLIADGIKQLGFRIEDVKILINSHAHYDHAGGLAELKRLTGAQLMLSEADATLVASGGKDDLQWGARFTYEPVKADRLLKDKDRIELGGVTMTARLTPGHTKGCTTWIIRVDEGGRSYDVVLFGSTTTPGYKLVNNAAYPDIVADFQNTFRLLRSLPCDVFLAPHGSFFNLEGKMARLARGTGANPFVDGKTYRNFLDRSEREFVELLDKQRKRPG